jgi:hypothetical protein
MSATETRLSLHRSLYLLDAVRAAADTYGPYAESIAIDEQPEAFVVTLRGYDAGYGEDFGDNFANHALFETVVRTRQTLAGVAL